MAEEQPAARLLDEISHTDALSGFLLGAIVGLAAGVAIVAATVATGGAALAVIAAVGAGVATTGGTALFGESLGATFTSPTGTITAVGSLNVLINNRPAARAITDLAVCSSESPSPPKPIATGSTTVFVNNFPAARKTDKIVCGAEISSGSSDVQIGGPAGKFLAVDPEVPAWMNELANIMVVAGTIVGLGAGAAAAFIAEGVCGLIAFGGEAVGSFLGGELLGAIGGTIGEAIGGERGRIIGEFGANQLGGFLGGHLGRRATSGHPVDVASGELFTTHTDFEFTGPLPASWTRVWMSSSRSEPRPGGLGWKWHHPFDIALAALPLGGAFVARLKDGRLAVFIAPAPERPSVNTVEQLILETDGEAFWLTDYDGVRHSFGPLDPVMGIRRLVALSDANGNSILLRRNSNGALVEIVDSGHRRYAVRSDETGQILAIDGPDPDHPDKTLRLVSYLYDGQGDLVGSADARGGQMRYAYQNHLMVSERHRAGLTYTFVWDDVSRGHDARCVDTWGTRASGEGVPLLRATLRYDPARRTTEVRNGEGAVTLYVCDALHRVVSQTDALGRVTKTHYDRGGRIILIHEPGASFRYSYDDLGRLTKRSGPTSDASLAYATDELGLVPLGRLQAFSEAGGAHTWFDHDARGNVTIIHDSAGAEKRIVRDARGWPLALIDKLGTAWRWQWSEAGELLAEGPGRAARYRYTHDRLGRLASIQRGQDGIFRFTRDENGNIVRVARPDGGAVTIAYDADDQPISHRDPLGHVTEWAYDGLRYAIRKVRPDGRIYRYDYNSELKLVALTNPKGERYRLDYDLLGRLTKEAGFDRREVEYRYTREGWLDEVVDAGRSTLFERDTAGRMTRKRFADGMVHEYDYDEAGRVLSARSPERSLGYSYDTIGRVVREEQDGLATTHDFDARGRRVRSVLPDGRSISSQFGEDGLYQSIKFDDALLVRVTRDDAGRETARESGNVHVRQDYDPQGRLISQAGASIAGGGVFQRAYRYDKADRILEIADSLRGAMRYRYDECERLIATDGWAAESFVPDPADNFLSADAARRGAADPAPGNRLLTDGRHGFEYDAHGNRIRKYRLDRSGPETLYRYGADNQLREVRERSADGVRLTRFGYDAFGRRAYKDSTYLPQPANDAVAPEPAPVRTTFLWNGDVLLAESRDAADPLATVFVYEPNGFRPLAQLRRESPQQPAHIFRYHLDHLGTPCELLNDNGRVVWAARYRGFGGVAGLLVEEVPQPLRFQGQYCDEETGLHYNFARYYAPDERCFLQQDPIRLLGGENFSLYVQNPLAEVDPFGLIGVNQGGYSVYHIVDTQTGKVVYVGISDDPARRAGQHAESGRIDKDGRYRMEVVEEDLTYGQARGYEQADIEHYKTRQTSRIGEPIEAGEPNRINSYDRTRTDDRAKAFDEGYEERMNTYGGCG